tara:strand:- start:190 stop:738 length:549 start_codon:yes stop_codon:yes gene_type:complete
MCDIALNQKQSKEIISLGIEQLSLCKELDKIALNGIWTETHWRKELEDPERISLGIINENRLLSLASGCSIVNEFHLTLIAVHPNFRNQGLAKLILSNLLQRALTKGCSLAILEVDNTNKAAINLYSKFGFKTAGIRKEYCKNGNDALIKVLDLINYQAIQKGVISSDNRPGKNLKPNDFIK